MTFTAGQKLRASDLNALGGGTVGGGSNPTGGTAIMTTNVTVTNSTSFSNATGLAFDLAASSTYVFDAWILYTAIAAADMKMRPGPPSGGTGYWSLVGFGRDVSPTIDVGGGAAFMAADLGTSLTVAGDSVGTTLLAAVMHGYVTTTTAGTQQLVMAQRSANATGTVLKAGSWLRVTKVS